MIFSEPLFLFLFLPVTLFAFYAMAKLKGTDAALLVTVLASCIFYSRWGNFFLLLFLCSILVNYLTAVYLLTSGSGERNRKLVLWAGQIYNIGTLFWFKYHFYFDYYLSDGKEGSIGFSMVDAAIPIGISFYTFQQAVFLADAFARAPEVSSYLGGVKSFVERVRGLIRYCAFVCFFPHLVIGPIMTMKEFQPQVHGSRFGRFRRSNIEVGAMLILIGLFKKLVIADHLALPVGHVFSASEAASPDLTTLAAWAGAFAFYAQLYFDFSGYSDMALGASRMFGISLPINFDSPLKAVSIHDYYRRWHITLTRVLSRFIYTPLSMWGARTALKNRLSKPWQRVLMVWIPFLINFELIALWHGATGTFVLFGLIHGTWYILEAEVRNQKAWKRFKSKTPDWLRALIGRIIFIVPMVCCFALFRSATLDGFFYLIRSMLGLNTVSTTSTVLFSPSIWTSISMALIFIFSLIYLLPNSVEITRRYKPGVHTWKNPTYTPKKLRLTWRPSPGWALFWSAGFLICFYFIDMQAPFIYLAF